MDQFDDLSAFIKTTFLEKANQYFDPRVFVLKDLDPHPVPVYGHWMSIILLTGPQLRITLKVQYNRADFFALFPSGVEKEAAEDHEIVTGLMNEFCNLAAGSIKGALESKNIRIGMSIPVFTRAFDEVFVQPGQETLWNQQVFELSSGQDTLTCLSEIQSFDTLFLTTLGRFANPAASDSGEIEYF